MKNNMEERNENLSFNNDFRFKNEPDESTPKSAENMNVALDNTSWLKHNLNADNAGAHNSIFRGKDITKYYDDESLWTRISSGTFDDLFVGDYIKKNDTIWRIACFDYYSNKGDTPITDHHALIVPDTILAKNRMNSTNTTDKGVANSEMYTTTLNNILAEYIEPIFTTHVLQFRQSLTTGINSTGYNRKGENSGCSNAQAFSDRKISLLNEIQLYGSIVFSSAGYDTGVDNSQLSLFSLAPEFIYKPEDWFWLRDIVDSSRYANVYAGVANRFGQAANAEGGIRPYFLID